jgi:hypothetical protein
MGPLGGFYLTLLGRSADVVAISLEQATVLVSKGLQAADSLAEQLLPGWAVQQARGWARGLGGWCAGRKAKA